MQMSNQQFLKIKEIERKNKVEKEYIVKIQMKTTISYN